jgi:hypothetical protein
MNEQQSVGYSFIEYAVLYVMYKRAISLIYISWKL